VEVKTLELLPSSLDGVSIELQRETLMHCETECNYIIKPGEFSLDLVINYVKENGKLPRLNNGVGWSKAGVKRWKEQAKVGAAAFEKEYEDEASVPIQEEARKRKTTGTEETTVEVPIELSNSQSKKNKNKKSKKGNQSSQSVSDEEQGQLKRANAKKNLKSGSGVATVTTRTPVPAPKSKTPATVAIDSPRGFHSSVNLPVSSSPSTPTLSTSPARMTSPNSQSPSSFIHEPNSPPEYDNLNSRYATSNSSYPNSLSNTSSVPFEGNRNSINSPRRGSTANNRQRFSPETRILLDNYVALGGDQEVVTWMDAAPAIDEYSAVKKSLFATLLLGVTKPLSKY